MGFALNYTEAVCGQYFYTRILAQDTKCLRAVLKSV